MRRIGPITIVLALALSACTSAAGHAPSAHPPTPAPPRETSAPPTRPLSATIRTPTTTLTAGSTVRAHVVVANRTGRAIHVAACGSPFQIALVNHQLRQAIAWLDCLERITIPRGTSRWPVTIRATYTRCGDGRNTVPCVHSNVPPLPTGTYRAVLVQVERIVPTPPPVHVVVTAA